MKRKIITTLLAVCAACTLMVGVTGCKDPHVHSYVKPVATEAYLATEATCTEKATYYFSCECGAKGVDTFEYGEALGHDFVTYVPDGNAKCEVDGTKTAQCSRNCGESDTVVDVGSALSHSFTNYESDGDATCEVDGHETAYCDHGCGTTDNRVEVDSKLGHSFTNYQSDGDATCEVDGHETAYCDHGCGTTDNRVEVDSKLGHSYTNYVYNDDAECEVDGTETAQCDNGCGVPHTRTKEGTALEHSYINYESNGDATCEEDGTKTAQCENGCGVPYTVTDQGSALGHSYTNYVPNGDATCEEDGTKTAQCDNGCGGSDTIADEGSALGHSYTNYVPNGDATCDEDGTKTAQCDNGCGESDTIADEGSALGHDYGDWEALGDGTFGKVCANDPDHVVTASIETLDEEILYSVANGEYFNQEKEVVDFVDVVGTDAEIDKAYVATEEGDQLLELVDGKMVFATSDELQSYQVTIFAGDKIVKIGLNVATLVIDEVEDFEYFTYTGAFVLPEESASETSQNKINLLADHIIASESEANQLKWNGYYLMVKDIDATGYTHSIAGTSGIGVAVPEVGGRQYDATWEVSGAWSDYYNPWTKAQGRGLTGTFDGNGYVISNLATNADGIFGVIRGGAVKNVGLINSGRLARLAFGATVDNAYVSMASTSSIIYSTDSDSIISNTLIENAGVTIPYSGMIGVYETDYTNITSQTDEFIGTMATLNNVIVVAKVPFNTGYFNGGQSWSFGAARYDAATVDGVANATTNNVAYSKVEGTENRVYADASYSPKLVAGAARFTTLDKMIEAGKAENSTIYDGFTSDVWEVVNGRLVFASMVEDLYGIIIAEEYNYSAADGQFFNSDGEVKSLAEIIGASEAVLTAGTDKDGNEIVVDGAITGVASSKDGLVQNVFTLVINGKKYAISVNVATLILDEAEDFKHFVYNGAFTGEGVDASAMVAQFGKTAFAERAITWNGYYMLAKDIDASTATFGTAENPFILSGSATIGAIGKTSARWVDANSKGTWDAAFYLYSPYYRTTHIPGFKGVFDGNGYTVSNFKIGNNDGLFGQIYGGTIKNLGWVNSGSLAGVAFNTVIDNCYVSMDTTRAFITSANTATTVSNTMFVNNGVTLPNAGIFGVYEQDYNNNLTDATIGTMAAFNNVVIVSQVPINGAVWVNGGQSWSFCRGRYDAATVNGVDAVVESNVAYSNAVGTANRIYSAGNYTMKTVAGAARYTSVAKLVESYNANNDLYSAFTGSVWSVVDGVLTFGA